MERAQALMRSFGDCELAVLFSSVMAVSFYENLGWRVAGRFSMTRPRRGPRGRAWVSLVRRS